MTTTRLDVPTGSRDVVQSRAAPHRGGRGAARPDGLVSLFVSEDGGGNWSRTTMEPVGRRAGGASRFAFTLASVDRDLRYYVTAGDATSRTYAVRVRRPPAVERFAVQYEYPAYTGTLRADGREHRRPDRSARSARARRSRSPRPSRSTTRCSPSAARRS